MFWRINLLPKSPGPWCAVIDVVKHLKEKLWSLRLYRVFQSWTTNRQLNDCLIGLNTKSVIENS